MTTKKMMINRVWASGGNNEDEQGQLKHALTPAVKEEPGNDPGLRDLCVHALLCITSAILLHS